MLQTFQTLGAGNTPTPFTPFLRRNFSESTKKSPVNQGPRPHTPQAVAPGDTIAAIVDRLTIWKLWSETDWRLDSMQRRALEGKQVDEAQAFASYVLNARLPEIIGGFEWSGDLRADGAGLRRKAEKLQEVCRAQFHKGNFKPSVEMSEIEKINHKLDLIAAHIAGRPSATGNAPSAPPRGTSGGAGGALLDYTTQSLSKSRIFEGLDRIGNTAKTIPVG